MSFSTMPNKLSWWIGWEVTAAANGWSAQANSLIDVSFEKRLPECGTDIWMHRFGEVACYIRQNGKLQNGRLGTRGGKMTKHSGCVYAHRSSVLIRPALADFRCEVIDLWRFKMNFHYPFRSAHGVLDQHMMSKYRWFFFWWAAEARKAAHMENLNFKQARIFGHGMHIHPRSL